MKRSSTARRDLTPSLTTVGLKKNKDAVRQDIRRLTLGIPAKELAEIAGVTPEGAQHWKEGHRAIDSANLINLARTLPQVRAWLMDEIDAGSRSAQADAEAIARKVVREMMEARSEPR